MPRVLRIINRFILGGPVLNALILSKYLPDHFETKLLAGSKDHGEKTADNLIEEFGVKPTYITEMRRQINPFNDLVAYRTIKQLIKEYKPDIVHTHAAKSGALGRLAASECKVPVILHTFHGHVFHSYFNKTVTSLFLQLERQLAKKSTKIIAISDLQKQDLAYKYKICDENKIEVVPNGIMLGKFETDQDIKRKQWRDKYHISPETTLVGIVGRVAPIKNHEMFIKVVHQYLNAPGADANIKFVVVGDGDILDTLKAQMSALNIKYCYCPENNNDASEAQVFLTSWQMDMDYVYAGLDIVCLTSRNEGTPISLIEAQASRRPVISTRVGAVLDTIQNDVSGFVVESNDVDGFTDKLKLLIDNKDLRMDMGEKGNQFVHQKYSHIRLANDVGNLYDRLLSSR